MKERILEQMQNSVKDQSIVLNSDSALPDLLDSITFINMVVTLETEFGFEFDDDMFLITKFPTANDMMLYVESKIAS